MDFAKSRQLVEAEVFYNLTIFTFAKNRKNTAVGWYWLMVLTLDRH